MKIDPAREEFENKMLNNREEQDTFEEAKEFYRRDSKLFKPFKLFWYDCWKVVAAHVIDTFVANVFFGKNTAACHTGSFYAWIR